MGSIGGHVWNSAVKIPEINKKVKIKLYRPCLGIVSDGRIMKDPNYITVTLRLYILI